jgi:hypothetical protein
VAKVQLRSEKREEDDPAGWVVNGRRR